VGQPPLAPDERDAISRLLAAPKLEVLPLGGVESQLSGLGRALRLAVAASPSRGLEAGVRLGERLRAAGHDVVVHIAAHMVSGRTQLQDMLTGLNSAGVDGVFVVGGDATQAGPYADALSLLREMHELGRRPPEVGIACYPQGHPAIPDDRLLQALREKAPMADYMTTQLCFDAAALRRWVAARRDEGLTLPLDIGVPGALEVAHLLRVSARIGVTDAARFVVHQPGLMGRFLRPRGYRPDGLIRQMAPMLADPRAAVRGLHVYTFNQVERTDTWLRGLAGRL
jgi:methylenetetrahydrofolate reductase (NADPH)